MRRAAPAIVTIGLAIIATAATSAAEETPATGKPARRPRDSWTLQVGLAHSAADDNHYAGILSYAGARVSFSHATGNAVIDLTTELPPRVTSTTCDHSAALEETGAPGIYAPTGPPWAVCAGD